MQISDLSQRERSIVENVAAGDTNFQVGARLGTSEHVVKNYLRAIYDKLGLWNRTELSLWWIRQVEP